MDGRTFNKILKDCKILDSKVTSVDADLIFAKVKAKGAKKITHAEFEEALRLVAAKKGVDMEAIQSTLATGEDIQEENPFALYFRAHHECTVVFAGLLTGQILDAGVIFLSSYQWFAVCCILYYVCGRMLLEGVDGPILYGTKADNVRFHDDKTTYTGVHKMGGPTTVDDGRVQFNDLSKICDRTEYDIRGVKKGIIEQKTGDSK
ncbi:hypothetical protein ACSSS7_000604 [Eimeria intestinalis]